MSTVLKKYVRWRWEREFLYKRTETDGGEKHWWQGKKKDFFFNSLFSFIIYYSVNITQIDNNHGKETEENLKSYYLEQKKHEFSHKVFGRGDVR